MLGKPTLSPVAGLGLKSNDEVDHVVEAAAGSVMATGGFMCCCGVRDGRSTPSGCTDSVARWACNYAIKPEAPGQGEAAGRSSSGDTLERDLGDGLRARSACNRTQAARADVDTFTRFSRATEVRFNFRGTDVVEVLERVGRELGFPSAIRVDQGTEFVSRDLDLWAYQRGVTLDFSRPGKPTDNAFIESWRAASSCADPDCPPLE